MSRISYITPENFTEAQQLLFKSITGGKRGEGRSPEDLLNSERGDERSLQRMAQNPRVRRSGATGRRDCPF